MTTVDKILAALDTDEPLTARTIAYRIGVADRTARRLLKVLVDEGRVHARGRPIPDLSVTRAIQYEYRLVEEGRA